MTAMDERVRQFRDRNRRGPCPDQLKAVAVGYSRERLSAGFSLGRVAAELQTKAVTLRCWLEEGSESPFRAVQVVPLAIEAASRPREQESGVVLVTRQGHRVYGLGPAALAQLLGALG